MQESHALLRACGAGQWRHSGRTLLDHLQGTHDLLQGWGSSQEVCMAGLFHSIYGTNSFLRRSLGVSDRLQVRAVLGANAEALAWMFCSVERPLAIIDAVRAGVPTAETAMINRLGRMNREPLSALPWQVCALAEIECANLIEQNSDGAALRELYCLAISFPGVLSASARAAVRSYLSRQLSRTPRSDPEIVQ